MCKFIQNSVRFIMSLGIAPCRGASSHQQGCIRRQFRVCISRAVESAFFHTGDFKCSNLLAEATFYTIKLPCPELR